MTSRDLKIRKGKKNQNHMKFLAFSFKNQILETRQSIQFQIVRLKLLGPSLQRRPIFLPSDMLKLRNTFTGEDQIMRAW